MVGSEIDPNDSGIITSLVLSTTLSITSASNGWTMGRPQTRTPSTTTMTRKRKGERKRRKTMSMLMTSPPHLKSL